MKGSLRGMLYSHDSYGLGHLRRTLAIASSITQRWTGCSLLVATGSPVSHRFTFPERTTCLKLPTVVKVGDDVYASPDAGSTFEQLRRSRAETLLQAARRFRPNFLIVDHAPAGLKGELLPTLAYLKKHLPDTTLIAGLRDLLDEPSKVRRSWTRDGVYGLLDRTYDMVLVYGQRELFDLVDRYALPESIARKTRFIGYVSSPTSVRVSREETRRALRLDESPLVVVTAGGGGDGYELMLSAAMASDLDGGRSFQFVLVVGPLMPRAHRQRLAHPVRPRFHVINFTDDMSALMNAADAVVSFGGYNSMCEAVRSGRPTLIVPRVWPRLEQLMRARAFEDRGLVRVLDPRALSPGKLLREIDSLLTGGEQQRQPLDMGGLNGVNAAIEQAMLDRWMSRPLHNDGSGHRDLAEALQ